MGISKSGLAFFGTPNQFGLHETIVFEAVISHVISPNDDSSLVVIIDGGKEVYLQGDDAARFCKEYRGYVCRMEERKSVDDLIVDQMESQSVRNPPKKKGE